MKQSMFLSVVLLASFYSCGKKVVKQDKKTKTKTRVVVKSSPGVSMIIERNGGPLENEKPLKGTVLIDKKNNEVYKYSSYGWLQIGQTDTDIKLDVITVEDFEDIENVQENSLYYINSLKKGYLFENGEYVEKVDATTPSKSIIIEGVDNPTPEAGRHGDVFINIMLNKAFKKNEKGEWVAISGATEKDLECADIVASKKTTDEGDICIDSNEVIYKIVNSKWKKVNSLRVVETKNIQEEKNLDENTVYLDEDVNEGFIYKNGKIVQIFKQELDFSNHVIREKGDPRDLTGYDGDIYINTEDDSKYLKVESKWLNLVTEKTIIKEVKTTVKSSSEKYIIHAEPKEDTNLNIKNYVLPYLNAVSIDGKKVLIENLVNKDTNAKSEDINVNKNAQVIFRFDFNKVKNIVKLNGTSKKIMINLKVNRASLDDNGSTEIFCFLNIGQCSGQPFMKKSRYSFLLNPEFFKETKHPHINKMFVELLKNDKTRVLRNEHSKKLKVVNHTFNISLSEMFEMTNEEILKTIEDDKVLTFVLADDLSLERLPFITIEMENSHE